jgi:TPR repeat protein
LLLKIELPKMTFDEANAGKLLLGAGAELRNVSDFASDDEVLLNDSPCLRVTKIDFDSSKNRYTVSACVDLDFLRNYYAIFEAQEAAAVSRVAAKTSPAKAPDAKPKPVSDGEQLFRRGLAIFRTPNEPRKVAELLRRAADLSHPDAMAAYGECLEFGRGVRKDKATAASFYRRGNDAGSAWALARLAWLRTYGSGGEPKDKSGGARMAQEAADRGSTAGIFVLGRCFFWGDGVPKDKARAFELYKKAAGLGWPAAMDRLGFCYGNGWGVTQDKAAAFAWFEKAADLGEASAFNHLGDC